MNNDTLQIIMTPQGPKPKYGYSIEWPFSRLCYHYNDAGDLTITMRVHDPKGYEQWLKTGDVTVGDTVLTYSEGARIQAESLCRINSHV